MYLGFKSKKARRLYYRKWRQRNVQKARKYGRRYYHRSKIKYATYQKKNRHKINRRRRIWRRNNPEQTRVKQRFEKYGITEEQFREMLKEQHGRCAICKKKEIVIDKRSGKVKTLSVDHDHKTNKIRRLLCHRCNLGIGIFKDNFKLLQAASEYLRTNKAG